MISVKNCFIINLDDRLDLWSLSEDFRKEWVNKDNVVTRIPGVNYNLETNLINKFIVSNRLNLNGSGFRKNKNSFIGELGCYMSHYNCWTKIVEKNLDCVLILEDGIEFIKKDFDNITINNDIDVLFVNQEMSMDNSLNIIGYGLQGYIVTQKGAKLLIEHCQTLECPIDLQVRNLCNSKIIKGSVWNIPYVKRNNQRVSSIDRLITNVENPNDKQDMNSIINRLLINLLNKNVNLDDFIESN